ncbi:hypothetical protein Ancab_001234 [Ancistrocladus abbreviatus]
MPLRCLRRLRSRKNVDFYRYMRPTIVKIYCFQPDDGCSVGTGVRLSSGKILSCMHILKGRMLDYCVCEDYNESDTYCKVDYTWKDKNLSLLKVKKIKKNQKQKSFITSRGWLLRKAVAKPRPKYYAKLASRDYKIRQGLGIYVIGNPHSYSFSILRGYVSRSSVGVAEIVAAIKDLGVDFDSELDGLLHKDTELIQIGGLPQGGSGLSGSPIFTKEGEIIGILIVGWPCFHYAVPLATIRQFVRGQF